MRSLFICAIMVGVAGAIYGQGKQTAPRPERFDKIVREDIFAGFGGDDERLARGLKTIDETLAKNPKHSEALVWRGAARVFQSAKAFQTQKVAEGLNLWNSGLKDMDDAVALDPKNPGVRIPRAASLLPAIHNAPPAMTKALIPKAVDDYETMYEMQKDHLDKIGTYPFGELRMGLADAYRLAGQLDKSKRQLEAIAKELPDSKYAKRAKEWLGAKDDAKLVHNCIGCHTK